LCGETEEVERILRQNPRAAVERTAASPERSAGGGAEDLFKDLGPKGWPPLLYLCFARLSPEKPDVARRRGLNVAADRLAAAADSVSEKEQSAPEVAKYERLAKDVVAAYSGDEAALQRINEHWGRSISLSDLRAIVWRVSARRFFPRACWSTTTCKNT
jgi:hypothetical protein